MRIVFLAAILAAGPAFAEEGWLRLTGKTAEAALVARTLAYTDGATQDFRADGGTTYTADGEPSQGRWGMRGDRYCSVWPPSDRWACYDLDRSADGLALRFTGDDGSTTTGQYVDQQ